MEGGITNARRILSREPFEGDTVSRGGHVHCLVNRTQIFGALID